MRLPFPKSTLISSSALVASAFSRSPAFIAPASAFTTSPAVHRLRAKSTLKSSGGNNAFLRGIGNAIESSLATLQSVLFYGRMPGPLPPGMHGVPTQFIAALGDPASSSGPSGAENWGIWRIDPGPRGVYARDFRAKPSLGSEGARMPAGWTFDPSDFWIEEYGRVMEKPDFPLPPGRYVVTGGRETTALLTVDPPGADGGRGWRLGDGRGGGGATLYDVTHLPCRSARYRPREGERRSPADADWSDFPVAPGAEMPAVRGCDKLDYAVLFVLAVDD